MNAETIFTDKYKEMNLLNKNAITRNSAYLNKLDYCYFTKGWLECNQNFLLSDGDNDYEKDKKFWFDYITSNIYPEVIKNGYELPLCVVADITFLLKSDPNRKVIYTSNTWPLSKNEGQDYSQFFNNLTCNLDFRYILSALTNNFEEIKSNSELQKNMILTFTLMVCHEFLIHFDNFPDSYSSTPLPLPFQLIFTKLYLKKSYEDGLEYAKKQMSLFLSCLEKFSYGYFMAHTFHSAFLRSGYLSTSDATAIDLRLFDLCNSKKTPIITAEQRARQLNLKSRISPKQQILQKNPASGNQGISKKGSFSTILRSLLARPEEDFLYRYYSHQLFYLDRSSPLEIPWRLCFAVIVDCTPILNIGVDDAQMSTTSINRFIASVLFTDFMELLSEFSEIEVSSYILLYYNEQNITKTRLLQPRFQEIEMIPRVNNWFLKIEDFQKFFVLTNPFSKYFESTLAPNIITSCESSIGYLNALNSFVQDSKHNPKQARLFHKSSQSPYDLFNIIIIDGSSCRLDCKSESEELHIKVALCTESIAPNGVVSMIQYKNIEDEHKWSFKIPLENKISGYINKSLSGIDDIRLLRLMFVDETLNSISTLSL